MRHQLAAEILPFLNLTPTESKKMPGTQFIKDKYYYFTYPGHDDFVDALRYDSESPEDPSILRGTHYTYHSGNQMEVNGIIGFYIYTKVGKIEVSASDVYDRFDAALAGDLGYTSIKKSALIIPAKGR
ncbi:hypothetical protein ADUPG1_007360 [Aduncisulcus paluster]|uniref:Uncharacterized protein n=1 Tax=Aduncisulcus paluster TaxID=2918883 RepID=A0ABQ5KPS6_9EUKA|nr:hypothetical protein ADUPG1_007360 [Aduncisulcus paluster]